MTPSRDDARRAALARRLYPEPARRDWLDGELMRAGQVAALFQVSRRTVNDWARAGRLPTVIVTPGGHRRFRARDVRALLERSRALAGEADQGSGFSNQATSQ